MNPWKFGDSELGNHHFEVGTVSFREGTIHGLSGSVVTPSNPRYINAEVSTLRQGHELFIT